ncbi:uncharacterized protein [Bombus fervidus]|uniref:uncharacterized protein n=1 Tax=Bombus fervidus TaxID=203811 RepID=UPI003D18A8A6
MANLFRGIMRLSNVLFVIVLIQLLVVSTYSEAVDDNVELGEARDIIKAPPRCPAGQVMTRRGCLTPVPGR